MSAASKINLNFAWIIKKTVPTSRAIVNRFEEYDPVLADPDSSTGWNRKFYIEWTGSDQDVGATDVQLREAWHTFRVIMIYAPRAPYNEFQSMIMSDRHDIIKALRDTLSWVGYSESHSGDDVGIVNRTRLVDQTSIDSDNGNIRMITSWKVYVREYES